MNKKLLLEKYIKVAVRKALKEQEEQQRKAEKAMYLIYRFPNLKRLMEDLMSPSFGRFVSSVDLVAPKPTVFNIGLINGQDFTITYLGNNNFSIKVSGKKYFDKNLAEVERASVAIAQLLEFSYAPKEEDTTSPSTAKDQELAGDLGMDGGGGAGETGGELGGGSTPPELTPSGEIPPAPTGEEVPVTGGEEEETPAV